MTIQTCPLDTLINGVRDYFTAQNVGAEVRLGFRERSKQINQGAGSANRVVFYPGATGKGGKISGVLGPGGNPRPLYIWDMLLTVSMWACDMSDPNDEAKQISAAFFLVERTTQAIHRVAGVAGQFQTLDWTVSPVERVHGVEVVGTMHLCANLFDVELETVTPTPTLTKAITI